MVSFEKTWILKEVSVVKPSSLKLSSPKKNMPCMSVCVSFCMSVGAESLRIAGACNNQNLFLKSITPFVRCMISQEAKNV